MSLSRRICLKEIKQTGTEFFAFVIYVYPCDVVTFLNTQGITYIFGTSETGTPCPPPGLI